MIQLATLGLTPEVVITGLQKILPKKLYIIHTENVKGGKSEEQVETIAKKLEKQIEESYRIPVELLKVEKFDSNAVIGSILQTISKERKENPDLGKKDFVINITGGTKAMVAGAACAAYLAQAKMYYVLHPDEAKGKELVRELPVPSRAENTSQGESTRTSSIVLEKIKELSPTNNKHLLEKLGSEKAPVVKKIPGSNKTKTVYKKFTGQILSYHLNKLDDAGLITRVRGWVSGKKKNNKLNTITITETGKYYAEFPDVIGEVI
jgi:hypothetical protein